jgi:hypothetical protein
MSKHVEARTSKVVLKAAGTRKGPAPAQECRQARIDGRRSRLPAGRTAGAEVRHDGSVLTGTSQGSGRPFHLHRTRRRRGRPRLVPAVAVSDHRGRSWPKDAGRWMAFEFGTAAPRIASGYQVQTLAEASRLGIELSGPVSAPPNLSVPADGEPADFQHRQLADRDLTSAALSMTVHVRDPSPPGRSRSSSLPSSMRRVSLRSSRRSRLREPRGRWSVPTSARSRVMMVSSATPRSASSRQAQCSSMRFGWPEVRAPASGQRSRMRSTSLGMPTSTARPSARTVPASSCCRPPISRLALPMARGLRMTTIFGPTLSTSLARRYITAMAMHCSGPVSRNYTCP